MLLEPSRNSFMTDFMHIGTRPKSKKDQLELARKFLSSQNLEFVLRASSLVVCIYKSIEVDERDVALVLRGVVKDYIKIFEEESVLAVPEAGLRGIPHHVFLSVLTAAWHLDLFLGESPWVNFGKVKKIIKEGEVTLSTSLNCAKAINFFAYRLYASGDFSGSGGLCMLCNDVFKRAVSSIDVEVVSPAQSRDLFHVLNSLRSCAVGYNLLKGSARPVTAVDEKLWTVDAVASNSSRIKDADSPAFAKIKRDFLIG